MSSNMPTKDVTATPMMEGPSAGPDHHRESTTPESSEDSPTLSYATALEHPEDQAALNLDDVSARLQNVQIVDQTAGSAAQAGLAKIEGHANIQQDIGSTDGSALDLMSDASAYGETASYVAQQDVVPAYNDGHLGGLPKIHTIAGAIADLTTGVSEFRTWDDYKLICLAGPKITLVLEDAGGQIQLACSRKLLMDFSDTFKLMNFMVGEAHLNITGLFRDLTMKAVAATFIQLYEMMQAGGLPVSISGDISFTRLTNMYIMADFLIIPCAKEWLRTYVKAKIQELNATWSRDFQTARMLEAVPEVQRPIGHVSPMQVQAFKLLDVQDAYVQARFTPRAKVVLPSQLARLVSDACPSELRLALQASGHLREDFLGAVAIFDLKRRVEARRGVNAGNHH